MGLQLGVRRQFPWICWLLGPSSQFGSWHLWKLCRNWCWTRGGKSKVFFWGPPGLWKKMMLPSGSNDFMRMGLYDFICIYIYIYNSHRIEKGETILKIFFLCTVTFLFLFLTSRVNSKVNYTPFRSQRNVRNLHTKIMGKFHRDLSPPLGHVKHGGEK